MREGEGKAAAPPAPIHLSFIATGEHGSADRGPPMTRLLILGCAPLAMLTLGGWWRRFDGCFAPAAKVETPQAGEIPLARLVREMLCRLEGKAVRQFVRLQMAVAEDLTI